MIENTQARWGWPAKTFHWIIALMILAIVPIGYVMAATYQFKVESQQMEKLHAVVSRLHQSIGLLILILVIARLGWRLKHTVPDLPVGLAAYQRLLAKANHVALYALLFILPLSGWASLSAFGGAPTYFLWMDGLPNLVPQVPLNDPMGFALYSRIHHFGINAGAALLVLHVVAALWHQFAMKDSVLRRMWPLG